MNRLGVVDWLRDVANNFTRASFLLRNHHGVVDNSLVSFVHRLHDCVVDNSFTSFVYRLANGVVHNLAVCFVNRLTNGVVDHFAVSFVHRLHNRVLDFTLVSFVNGLHDRVLNFTLVCFVDWSTNRVVNLTSVCLVDRLHDGVLTRLGLVNWLANRLVDRTITCFTLHARYVDRLVFHYRLVFGTRALLSLLLVDRTTDGLHDGVRCGYFATVHTGVLVANRTAVRCVSLARCSRHDGQQHWQYKQPSHFPFSLELLVCYWMNVWWVPANPWVKQE